MIKHVNDSSFKEEVLDKEGIYLVDFYATWCGPCSMIAPVLEDISNSRAGYNIVKVDVDQNPNISSKLGIDVIPTLCVYKNGKLVERQTGYRNKEQIVEMLEKYI